MPMLDRPPQLVSIRDACARVSGSDSWYFRDLARAAARSRIDAQVDVSQI